MAPEQQKLKMPRRKFLGSLVLGATLLFPHYLNAEESKTTAPSFLSLKQTGLPKEFKEKGFEIERDWNMNYNKELFIIGENHEYPNIIDLESKLIDYLIREYKADSLGLEGFYGNLNENLLLRLVNENINPFEEDLKKEFGKETIRSLELKGYLKKDDEKIKAYEKFFKQLKIPCYGLEEKDLFINTNNIIGITKIADYVLKEKTKYNDIKDIRLLERLFEFLKQRLPREGLLKDQTLESFIQDNYEAKKLREDFAKVYFDNLINQRNKAFAKNIEDYTKKIDSKRGIIITGHLHSSFLLAGFANHDNLQHYLKFNSLIVSSPGTK